MLHKLFITHCTEWSRDDGFPEKESEAPVELTIYVFTDLLIGYMQYYLQYLHIVVRLLMCYILCLKTPNLTVASLLANWCVCTLLPKPLTFIHLWLTCDWLSYFKLCTQHGLCVGAQHSAPTCHIDMVLNAESSYVHFEHINPSICQGNG